MRPASRAWPRPSASSYNLRVDNDGDAKQDVVLKVTFGKPNEQGVQKLRIRRNGRPLLRGKTSRYGSVRVNSNGKGVRAYAGMRDDPFFFDLDGFINILSQEPGKSFLGCNSPRTDKFAGTNVSSIVIELKPSLLTRQGNSNIGVWATTNKGSAQIDRMGRPAIATVFIPNNPFEVEGHGALAEGQLQQGAPGERPGELPRRGRRHASRRCSR